MNFKEIFELLLIYNVDGLERVKIGYLLNMYIYI